MTGRLAGKTVVVTGAARGLGRAAARALFDEGAKLHVCDVGETTLEGATTHRVDLRDRAACRRFVDRVLAAEGGVDVLVNNAGVLYIGSFEAVEAREWDETLAVNLTAPFLLAQGFLPSMIERGGGSIVNVSSRAGALGFAREAAYCASKFGLEGLTRALAAELEGLPVSVNTVTPGLRIKPTMMRDEAERTLPPEERSWSDAERLGPAFVLLAGARGRPSGTRFDLLRLAEAVEKSGYDLDDAVLEGLAE